MLRCQLTCVLTVFLIGLATPLAAVDAQSPTKTPAWLQQPMTLVDARHLVGRTGFGASFEELSALMNMTRMDAVHTVVNALETQPHVPMPAWVNAPAPHYWTQRHLSQSMKKAFNAERDKEIVQLRRWWVNNMLQTSSPQTERLVLFWHDHFATSYAGVKRRSVSMARQNQLFREMGTGSYRALLKAMIRDPAMLLYLNNESNRKGSPNENLARELLELFTMGEGNYDEVTVKEAARALTGYGISATHNLSFKLHGSQRDMEEKTLFGNSAVHDGDTLVDIILEQPEAAEHLVKKFWHAFISDANPSLAFMNTMSEQFRESDYDLQHLYSSVLMSEAFWQKENRLSLVKSPVTLLIGTARSLDYPKRAWTQIPSLLAMLGMDLFSPPNVAGWNEGAAFVSPGRLLNRHLAMQTLLSVPAASSSDAQSMSMDSSDTENHMMKSSAMSISSQGSAQSPLQVRLAGHFFQGAPQYKVSLHDSNEKLLWNSDVREIEIGYDSETFGKMHDMGQLAWQTVRFNPPANALSKSARVRVAFLNDAAGKKGDRNLFVESVSLSGKTFTTEGAQQESMCIPKNRLNAGRLYCGGAVAVELENKFDRSVGRDSLFTASSASLLSVQHKKHKLFANIALENVQTPEAKFHTVSFSMSSKKASELAISLNSFGCWPDCIEQWPECARIDYRSQQKSVVFPLRRGQNKNVDCHFDSITASEQALVKAIYKSIPNLVQQLSGKVANANQKSGIQRWQERIAGLESQLKSSVYNIDATPFSFDQRYSQPVLQAPILQSEVRPVALTDPLIAISNIGAFSRAANDAGVSLQQLLIGGAPAQHFPELQTDPAVPVEQQLEKLLAHPVYQVY